MKCGRFDAFGKLKFEEKNYYGALIWDGQLSGSVSNPI